MSLAAVLIVLGVILWLLFNPTIGIILLIIGVVLLVARFASAGHTGGPRRWYW